MQSDELSSRAESFIKRGELMRKQREDAIAAAFKPSTRSPEETAELRDRLARLEGRL